MQTLSLLLVFLVGPVSLAAAQKAREFSSLAWLPKPVEVLASSVERACAALPHHEVYSEPPRSTTCQVLRYVSLGRAADAAWSYALYRHTSVRFPGSSEPDTASELELVLLTAPLQGSDRLVAIAHTRQDSTGLADISTTLANHPAGVLLGVEFCINGTAGCWQEFLQRVGAEWRELADPRRLLVTELQRTGVLTGSADARLGAPHIDTSTLRGRAAFYDPKDPNCCPSRRVEFQLELTTQGLHLLTLAVVPDSL